MTNTCLRWLSPLTAVAALGLTSGCSDLDNCPDAPDKPILIEGGTTHLGSLFFESTTDDALDAFPAKTELKFEHGLGVKPATYQSFLSFTKNGTNGSGGGSLTEVAGNEVAYECVDSRYIVLKNDTCERSFFIRLVAWGLPDGDPDNHECGE